MVASRSCDSCAGALATDAPVAIQRIAIDTLEATSGIPAPGRGVFQTLGAFRLYIGEHPANAPLQLAIPVQGADAAQPGEEVFFLRRGEVLTETGTQPTWWLVDRRRGRSPEVAGTQRRVAARDGAGGQGAVDAGGGQGVKEGDQIFHSMHTTGVMSLRCWFGMFGGSLPNHLVIDFALPHHLE